MNVSRQYLLAPEPFSVALATHNICTEMDPVAGSLALVSALAQVMKVARRLYDIYRHVREVPQEILSVLIILEDARGWAELYAAVGQSIPRLESMDEECVVY